MVAESSTPPVRPPALLEATRKSTTSWQDDLQSLFHHAKDRFPDVVWELADDARAGEVEEVWGHKAIVYARAPPSFQARYFSFRPAPVASPLPYSNSPNGGYLPAQSALSLTLGVDYPDSMRSPSPYRAASPSPSSMPGTLLRLPTSISPALFSNELEYLYTGKGFGAAFEFLFDTSEKREEGDAEENRIDKLRKDLVFMWRSRLYSDVRIALTGEMASNHEGATAVFSSHRFMLVSRSPYFYAQLVSFGSKPSPGQPLTVNLPSPPFTPASLHFTLGFIYTGTLNFSNRTFDLDTGFHVMRSATYLSLQTLYDEIQARIMQEMMHGLFHAFLEFAEYERITGGKWGTGGCRCRQCARRAPRVLDFAVSPDVRNPHLERGARRALVGLFGEGWCTPEFATLPQKTKDGLMKGLAKRTTPSNIFPLLFAAHHAMNKLNTVIESWADGTREMVLAARKTIDDTLCGQSDTCFDQAEWLELMEADGGRFEDGEKVEWIMEAVRRGLAEKNAAVVYQTLVSSILLRGHPTEIGETLLSNTSHIRVQVEQTRMDVLRWLRKRWVGVRQEGGFDALEGWAIKEISHEIDVPVDDLISPPPSLPVRGTPTRTGPRASLTRADDTDSASLHSLRMSVLNRNMAKQAVGDGAKEAVASSASSFRSSRSTLTTSTTTHSIAGLSSTVRRKVSDADPRPDSKLTPSQSVVSSSTSIRSSVHSDADSRTTSVLARTTIIRASTSTRPRPSDVSTRPKSSAGSVTSVRSHASTIRKASPTAGGASAAGPSTPRAPPPPPPGSSRPTSSASTASTTFKTAPESLPLTRPVSTASTVSARSTARSPRSPVSPAVTLPRVIRPRRSSGASTAFATSSVTGNGPRVVKRPAGALGTDNATLSPAAKRSPSTTSARSSTSSASASGSKRIVVRRTASQTSENATPGPEIITPKAPEKGDDSENTPTKISMKGKGRAGVLSSEDKKLDSPNKSSDGGSTAKGSLRHKESTETITVSSAQATPAIEPLELKENIPQVLSPRGATLDIGIPCIISSKRKRFRAFARYIGEVEGELGPWVGVEVPVGESWGDEKLEGRQWNDGTWGGIRYFEIGMSSEWGDEERGSRRRRLDWVNGQKGAKREGDQLSIDRSKRLRSASPAVSDMSNSEYRGLFVRPQQVLYVVDAVGPDL